MKKKEIVYITGNKLKFEEGKAILNSYDIIRKEYKVIRKEYKIDEIQGTPEEIIKDKLKKAMKKCSRPCLVEDISLEIDGLNSLPGPYIKDFLKHLGIEGIYGLVKRGSKRARAVIYMGYGVPGKKPAIFKGVMEGRITKPSKIRKFGWDPVFIPKGYLRPFTEIAEKNDISHRRKAIDKLINYLKRRE